jgi:hypothetical protein
MTMDKHPFDARHRFQINILSDIETFKDMDETYVEPEPEEYSPRVSVFDYHDSSYLPRSSADDLCRNTFVLGSPTHKEGTNTFYTIETTSWSIGMASLRPQKSSQSDK